MSIRMLVAHGSAELYGSDRCLFDLLAGLERSSIECIVCLGEHGPLEEKLLKLGLEVHVVPLARLTRKLLFPAKLPCLPFALPLALHDSLRALDKVVNRRRIDVVYSNTLAVLGAAFWASMRRCPHIWHVHEIIERPRIVGSFLKRIASAASTRIICNSNQTQAWMRPATGGFQKWNVVWNGVEFADESIRCKREKAIYKRELDLNGDMPLLLMVGRISAMKGQDLLIDAVDYMVGQGKPAFQLLFVGGPAPGREEFITRLQERIARSSACAHIAVHSFTENLARFYRAADCLVVPSREPESFGLVAIEGMAYGLPVIAAEIGGLPEIVKHEETGLFFTPNNVQALSAALEQVLFNDELQETYGRNGHVRQRQLFSLRAYRSAIAEIIHAEASRTHS